ncbi:MAG: GAF domain-containing protein [Anaerolineae bacterium]
MFSEQERPIQAASEKADESLHRRVRELSLLLDTAEAISSSLDVDVILHNLALRLSQEASVAAFRAGLLNVEEKTFLLKTANFKEDGEINFYEERLSLESSPLLSSLVETRAPFIINDVHSSDLLPGKESAFWRERGVCSLLCLPLVRRGKVIGVLLLGRGKDSSWEDLPLLKGIASQATIAIENALLYQSLGHRVQALMLINDIGLAMTSTLNLERVLDIIMAEARKVLNAEAGSILLLDEETGEMVFEVSVGAGAERLRGHRLPPGKGICGWVAQQGRSILVQDVNQDSRFYRGIDNLTDVNTRSLLCAPLRIKERVIGAVEIINKIGGEFEGMDLMLLDSLARSAAVAIENARLYKRIAESEEKYRTLVENAQDAICRKDLSGNWLFLSRAIEDITGYPPEYYLAHPGQEIVHPDDRSWVQVEQDRLAKGELLVSQDLRYRIIHRDGSERWVSQTSYPVRDEEGRTRAIECIIRDITETRRMEDQLIQAAKLAATGKLAATIAHEVNNPLQAIRSCLEVVELRTGHEHPGWPYLDVAQKELARVAQVVKSLVDVYRPVKEDFIPVDVNLLLEEVLQLLEKQMAKSGVTVEKEMSPQPPIVFAMRSQLQQVFLNIILNALEAMPGGGKLRVVTELSSPDGRKKVRRPTHLFIYFHDTGEGIEPEVLERVFEPLFTTKAKGSGIGLSVSQAIIQHHRGTIEIESQVGHGTTVTIGLPLESRA